MAISVDDTTVVRWTGTPGNGTNITSASFTPPDNSCLVLCVNADSTNASDITIAVSDSLSGSWSNRVEMDLGTAGAEPGHASIWRRLVTTGASMTVSVQRSAGNGSTNRISCKLYIITGADTTEPAGATGKNHSATNNLSPTLYTSTADNSRAFYCGEDWNQNGTPTSTDTEDGADYAGAISVLSAYKAADTATAGTSVSGNLDAGGTGAAAWNWVAVEIKPAAAAGLPPGLGPDIQMDAAQMSIPATLMRY